MIYPKYISDMIMVLSFIDKWVEKTESTFISELWGRVKKTVTEVVKVVEKVVEYAVTFGDALLATATGANSPSKTYKSLKQNI